MAKRGGRRPFKKRGLVITEGQTEKQYIGRYRQRIPRATPAVDVKVVVSGEDPLRVVQRCINLRDAAHRTAKEYDWCACVVDVDQHANLQAAVSLAKSENVFLFVTNLKFEVWLLWHVTDKRAAHNSRELDNLMRKHELLNKKHLAPAFPIENYVDAVETSRLADPKMASGRVGSDPSTAMPLFLDLLNDE